MWLGWGSGLKLTNCVQRHDHQGKGLPMRVTTKWSKRPLFVVAIHVPIMNTRYP